MPATLDAPDITATHTDEITDLILSVVWGAQIEQTPDWLNLDLTFQQLKVMYALRQNGSLSMARLADSLLPRVSMPTITGIVSRLVGRRNGVALVERETHPEDRRVVRARLTDAGNAVIDKINGYNRAALNDAIALLDSTDRAALRASLEHLRAALDLTLHTS